MSSETPIEEPMDDPTELGKNEPRQITGRLLIVTTAVMWSSAGFFVKAPVFEAWPAEQRTVLLAFWRALFAGLLLLPLVRRPRFRLALVPMALIFALMNVTYMKAMVYTSGANAVWMQNTAPLWVFLLSALWLREPANRRDLLMLAFAAVGIAVILFFEYRHAQQVATTEAALSMTGVLYALASGVLYASVILCLRRLRAEDSAWLIALNLLVTAAVLAPQVTSLGMTPSGEQFAWLAAFGLLQIGLPYVLFARGLRVIRGPEASGIVLLEPLLLPVWIYLAWGNEVRWWTLVGGGLILTGLAQRYLRWGRRASTTDDTT
jgi:drug/metabolite transporter (DMT)-like permease